MDELRKLNLSIILGGILWMVGTYVLFLIFGTSRIIGLLVLVGWFILVAYILKYINLLRKAKAGKDVDKK